MITGETNTGFHFEIEEEALDDYDLLEALRELDRGDTTRITDVVDLLLGKEQKEALKAHIRADGKRVSTTRIANEVQSIFENCGPGKNL